jgi:hypothetical protein
MTSNANLISADQYSIATTLVEDHDIDYFVWKINTGCGSERSNAD